jgi:hypothetical protein
VCPLLKDFPGLRTFQVDNEVSYNIMHVSKEKGATYQLDYHPYITQNGGLFQQWLQERYGSIDRLNRAWRSRYGAFGSVAPPRGPGKKSRGDFVRTVDWIAFKEWMMAEFLRTLMEYAYDEGIRVPFVVNSPLIDDSCSYTFHRHTRDPRWQVVAGLDLYPGCVRPEELGWMQSMVEFARSTGCDRPAGIEICACEIYFRHHWNQERFDYQALFRLMTAAGLTDINYYWFADGCNFEGFGCLGPRQVYNAPVTREGAKRYQFDEIASNNRFILEHPEVHCMETEYAVAVTYDDLYSQASRFDSPWATNWHDDVIHGEENTGSLIDLLGSENIPAQMLHISDDFSKVRAPVLVLPAYDFWRRGSAEKLIAYVEAGGDALILGRIPVLDEQLKDYRVLAEWLGVRPGRPWPHHPRAQRTVTSVRFQDDDFQFHTRVQTYDLKRSAAQPIAWISGSDMVCGFEASVGSGRVRVFGAIPWHFMEASKTFIRKLLDGPNPQGLYRYVRKNKSHVFTTLLNVSDDEKCTQVGTRQVTVKPRHAEFFVQPLQAS